MGQRGKLWVCQRSEQNPTKRCDRPIKLKSEPKRGQSKLLRSPSPARISAKPLSGSRQMRRKNPNRLILRLWSCLKFTGLSLNRILRSCSQRELNHCWSCTPWDLVGHHRGLWGTTSVQRPLHDPLSQNKNPRRSLKALFCAVKSCRESCCR